MNIKRSNRTLKVMLMMMLIIGAIIITNVLYIMTSQKHLRSGINIKQFKDVDISNTIQVKANRGAIYDRNGEVIAQDEDTYTIIAYLNPTRKSIGEKPAYVKEIQKTARLLSEKLEMSENEIVQTLTKAKAQNLYQSELGIKGKNLNSTMKESIEALHLQGIGFKKSVKRNYPNGVFASHLVGFARYQEKEKRLKGQMGLENTLDKYLQGDDGEEVYQKDVNGNILPGTQYTKKYAEDGKNVMLTLDRNVQLTLQSSLQKTITSTTNGSLGWALALEVETGKILGYASYPSFDLNKQDVKEYIDIPANFAYEPGSVMKGITYAAAIDSGTYPYDQSFNSGVFNYGEDANGKIYRSEEKVAGNESIRDALNKDYGNITFDRGFIVSSNIGICELMAKYMDPEIYRSYLDKFGFLAAVKIPFVYNTKGSLHWNYASEKLSAGFGQGMNVNALQMAQAYSAILNNGKMVRPYVVDRIEDANNHKIIKQYDTKAVGEPISKKTSLYMRDLMQRVVEENDGTAHSYQMSDVSILAKTGTGEIAGQNGYNSGLWTSSIMMAAPADDPKMMIYYCFQGSDIINYSREPMKEAMRAGLVASNITADKESEESKKTYKDWNRYTMPSLINHSEAYIDEKLKGMAVNTVKIGNGNQIIKQYPKKGATIVSNQNIFLLSDGTNVTMPDMIGWTKKDVTAFWEMTGIAISMKGSGSVVKQSIQVNQSIDSKSNIEVILQ